MGMRIPWETVADLASERAVQHADRRAWLYLEDGEREGPELGYAALARRARGIAALLRDTDPGVAGRPVLLVYPPGLDAVTACLGCLYAGAIAVPVDPPHAARGAPGQSRVRAIAAAAGATIALTTERVLAVAGATGG